MQYYSDVVNFYDFSFISQRAQPPRRQFYLLACRRQVTKYLLSPSAAAKGARTSSKLSSRRADQREVKLNMSKVPNTNYSGTPI